MNDVCMRLRGECRTKPLEEIEQRKEDFPILFSFSQLDQLLLKIHSRKFLFILIQISIVYCDGNVGYPSRGK